MKKQIEVTGGSAFADLRNFFNHYPDYLFGHFSYDLKNEIEELHSSRPAQTHFPLLFFYVPVIVIRLTATSIEIGIDGTDHDVIHNAIVHTKYELSEFQSNAISIQPAMQRSEYEDAVRSLCNHILRGDCYEINYCQQFFAEDVYVDPLETYLRLTKLTPNPFSAFYKLYNNTCICASPERYFRKQGDTIISQPIKGTWHRDAGNKQKDDEYRMQLVNSFKDRTENVMVVDLVRNDLSRVCQEGTVEVTELFGVYSFETVHQMISTIRGKLKQGMNWIDVVQATFPMGSMTGAPKKRVMELIDQYETCSRGLFSGAIGYVTPDGDADFNVVIRSLFYDNESRYLSYHVGSAITANSNPADEYDECILKAAAIKKVLGV